MRNLLSTCLVIFQIVVMIIVSMICWSVIANTNMYKKALVARSGTHVAQGSEHCALGTY